MARPCVVWNESSFTYPATRPVQPMPETTASVSRFDLGFDQRPGETVDRGADAAARTPDVRHAVHAQERLDGIRPGSSNSSSIQSSGCLHDGVQNLVGIMNAAARVGNGDGLRFAAGGALYLVHHLSEVQFRHDEGLERGRPARAMCFSGNGHAEMMRNLPTLRCPRSRASLDGALRHARRDAVGDHDHIGVFEFSVFAQGAAVRRAARILSCRRRTSLSCVSTFMLG